MPSTVRAGDPAAMAAMATTLDEVAGELDVHRALARAAVAETGADPPDLVELQQVAAWVRATAGDLRRRALDLLSADRPWRHGGLLDHAVAVAKAGWSGVVDGLESMGAGLATAGRMAAADMVEPGRIMAATVDRGWSGAAGEALAYGRRRLALDETAIRNLEAQNPQTWVSSHLDELHEDGFWAMAEDAAHDGGTQVPGAVLFVASSGAGAIAEEGAALRAVATVTDAASTLANASYLAPPTDSGSHHAALALSVDAGEGRRVGLDPTDGRFVVFESTGEGITEHATRWSGLGPEDRRAMQDAGVVDAHGHLRTVAGTSG